MSKAVRRLGDYFANRRERGDESLPVLSVTLRDGLVPRESIDRRTESELEAHEHLAVRKGDIAYNMMRMWQGANGLAPYDAVVSPAYVVLRSKDGIDPLFASYWFKSEQMIYLFWAYSYGLTEDRLRLYYKDFATIRAAPPRPAEQQRIAEILANLDKTIRATTRLAGARLSLKKAYAELLCQDVTTASLGSVTKINSVSLANSTDPDFRFEYFPIGDEENELSGWMRFSEAPSRARRLASAGDVIYSTVRPLLRRLFRAPEHPSAVYSTGYAVLPGGPRLDAGFLSHLLTTNPIERQIYARATGTGYPAISPRDLAEIQVPLPAIDRQRAIGRFLDAITRELELLDAQVRALGRVKRGLMQKLLPKHHSISMPATGDAAE